ncbi:hypothetical protein F0562_005869 [Nyssa sinensis]|uniref:Enoyl-CoA hydratase n=1 Tax=Nyssa sinensis TaxID=561372 RepID=A0A5J5AP90_9ASTE|nr:hypothetical protein F0562_005869 [Nyssa sinensis]
MVFDLQDSFRPVIEIGHYEIFGANLDSAIPATKLNWVSSYNLLMASGTHSGPSGVLGNIKFWDLRSGNAVWELKEKVDCFADVTVSDNLSAIFKVGVNSGEVFFTDLRTVGAENSWVCLGDKRKVVNGKKEGFGCKIENHGNQEKLILVNREPGGIAYVTINRPKSLNSLTKQMMTDLARAFKSLGADDSVRVIILSGSGRSFCSGVDLTAAEDVFKGDVKDLETDPVAQMERCRKPIIGAIGGFAVTAGFEIALACDILVAAKGAKFMDTHARFGIFPSWGLSQKLSRIIGPNRAREVSLTAMPITAEQAERWGLANHVVEGSELLKKAREVAEAITKNNQDLVLRYKSVINDGLKLQLGHALALEKERAHEYYNGMTKEQFKKMQEFIAGRNLKKPPSKL